MMTSKLAVVCAALVFVSSASAQINADKFASDLLANYGPPLPRQTFHILPRIEMVVDFARNGHVCKIQLPPVAPSTEPGQENVWTPKAIDDLVLELVPPSMRVGDPKKLLEAMGRNSNASMIFENVTISERQFDGRRTGVSITFPKDQCFDAF